MSGNLTISRKKQDMPAPLKNTTIYQVSGRWQLYANSWRSFSDNYGYHTGIHSTPLASWGGTPNAASLTGLSKARVFGKIVQGRSVIKKLIFNLLNTGDTQTYAIGISVWRLNRETNRMESYAAFVHTVEIQTNGLESAEVALGENQISVEAGDIIMISSASVDQPSTAQYGYGAIAVLAEHE